MAARCRLSQSLSGPELVADEVRRYAKSLFHEFTAFQEPALADEDRTGTLLVRRKIRWAEVNGHAGVAACARTGRLKSAWPFAAPWFVATPATSRQHGSRR